MFPLFSVPSFYPFSLCFFHPLFQNNRPPGFKKSLLCSLSIPLFLSLSFFFGFSPLYPLFFVSFFFANPPSSVTSFPLKIPPSNCPQLLLFIRAGEREPPYPVQAQGNVAWGGLCAAAPRHVSPLFSSSCWQGMMGMGCVGFLGGEREGKKREKSSSSLPLRAQGKKKVQAVQNGTIPCFLFFFFLTVYAKHRFAQNTPFYLQRNGAKMCQIPNKSSILYLFNQVLNCNFNFKN